MEHLIHIGDFVKLTGTTLKTVLYYHKIGLLPEPERSAGGYRLYGAAALSRMQLIKHYKRLGFDLPRIKEMLGEENGQKNMRDVLLSLREELLQEKNGLETRLQEIEKLLAEDAGALTANTVDSSSFRLIDGILGNENMEAYAKTCPELVEGQRRIFGILDDFQWGTDYRDNFKGLAEFFKDQPQIYESALAFGARLAALAALSADDPSVSALAREAAAFIQSVPPLKEMLAKKPQFDESRAALYDDMVATVRTPAQRRFGRLLQEYLTADRENTGGDDHEKPYSEE